MLGEPSDSDIGLSLGKERAQEGRKAKRENYTQRLESSKTDTSFSPVIAAIFSDVSLDHRFLTLTF